MAEPTPIEDVMVNDRYWLGLARTILSAGVTRRDEAADKLAATIAWLWTAYSAAAIIGTALAGRRFTSTVTVIILLPALLLVVAYLFATWAMMPIGVKFDPRDATEIEKQHVKAMGRKAYRLLFAVVSTALAGIALMAAILETALATPAVDRSFNAVAVKHDNQVQVVYNGTFAAQQIVTITVQSVDTSANPGYALNQASSSGDLNGTISVPESPKGYRVTASWSEDHVDHATTLPLDSPI